MVNGHSVVFPPPSYRCWSWLATYSCTFWRIKSYSCLKSTWWFLMIVTWPSLTTPTVRSWRWDCGCKVKLVVNAGSKGGVNDLTVLSVCSCLRAAQAVLVSWVSQPPSWMESVTRQNWSRRSRIWRESWRAMLKLPLTLWSWTGTTSLSIWAGSGWMCAEWFHFLQTEKEKVKSMTAP